MSEFIRRALGVASELLIITVVTLMGFAVMAGLV